MANFETVASKQRKRDRAAEIMFKRNIHCFSEDSPCDANSHPPRNASIASWHALQSVYAPRNGKLSDNTAKERS